MSSIPELTAQFSETIKAVEQKLTSSITLSQLKDLAKDLEQIRHRFLSKKGPITALYAQMGKVPPEEKKSFGASLNTLKQSISSKIETLSKRIGDKGLELEIASETVDVTAPTPAPTAGSIHPCMALLEKMVDVLSHEGFRVITSPSVDTDQHNFTDLNFADDHPARDMQDTFYLSKKYLLRTHTSNGQILAMKNGTPPIRVVIPGRCFRSETVTARSHILFHQLEGLYIDKNVNLTDLIDTMRRFFSRLFERELELRIRPSYFPFVEPGVEVDIECLICSSKGCSICKHSGWLEVAGAGMVHPNVLKSGGIDPKLYRGFAWGMGIERLVMILGGINDIRLFTHPRSDFLRSFASF